MVILDLLGDNQLTLEIWTTFLLLQLWYHCTSCVKLQQEDMHQFFIPVRERGNLVVCGRKQLSDRYILL